MTISAKLSISIAMCTYNGARYLDEQLQSLREQTRLPDELVVCDDGSTDDTLDILQRFADLAPFPVRIFRNERNLGSTKNFEKAIGLCTGELIALCDQDDVWLREKLELQAGTMEANPEFGGVFSDADLMNDRGSPIGRQLWTAPRFTKDKQRRFRSGGAAAVLLERNVAWGATMMVRANLRPTILNIPEPWIHDAWIAWMLVMYSKLDFIPAPLIRYRLHENQVTGIEELMRKRPLTLYERLVKGRRDDPSKHRRRARELWALYERLSKSSDTQARNLLPRLQEAISFFADSGIDFDQRCLRLRRILKHALNYGKYENGWKSFARDIILVALPVKKEALASPALNEPRSDQ